MVRNLIILRDDKAMKTIQTKLICALALILGAVSASPQANANDFGPMFQDQTPPGLAESTVEDEGTPELLAQTEGETQNQGMVSKPDGTELNDIMPAAGSEENEEDAK